MALLHRLFNPLPAWARQLPPHLRPSRVAIRQLEAIRRKAKQPHGLFMVHIAGHPEMTRRVLRNSYRELRHRYPNRADAELREIVLASRINPLAGDNPFGLLTLPDEQVEAKVKQITSRYRTLEDFIDAVLAEEAKTTTPFPQELQWAASDIGRILWEDSTPAT